MVRGDRWLYGVMLGGALAACVTNHEQLEKKPNTGQGGAAGSGAPGTSGSFPQLGGSGGEMALGGGHADDEPPGASVLTVVNGVVDAPSFALCFAKVDAEASALAFGEPVGDGPLEYGHSLVLHEIAGAALDEDTLQPFVIAGELELIAGLDCEAAIARARAEEFDAADLAQGGAAGADASDAGAVLTAVAVQSGEGGTSGEGGSAGTGGSPALRSRLRVRSLPVIAPGTLTAGRSLLLVAAGCMGGATYEGEHAEEYCGEGFSAAQPTVSAVLVSLSRQVAFDHAGMQVLNASLANDQVDVRSRPAFPSQDSGLSIVSNLVQGQVAPRPASLLNAAFDYGSTRLYRLEVSTRGSTLFDDNWKDALSRGNLTALENGRTYALVLSGPQADLKPVVELWNPPVLTVIAVDPE